MSSFLRFSCSLSQQESPVTPTVAFLTSGEEERRLEAASEAAVVGERERGEGLTRVFRNNGRNAEAPPPILNSDV